MCSSKSKSVAYRTGHKPCCDVDVGSQSQAGRHQTLWSGWQSLACTDTHTSSGSIALMVKHCLSSRQIHSL